MPARAPISLPSDKQNVWPEREDVLACVEAVCSSSLFAGSKRLIGFLRFVVDETTRGAGDKLNEYSIGVDVYERGESFDPRTDNIVRVEAHRLRSKLDEYYRTVGAHDDWIIGLPRGSYRVAFQRRILGGPGSLVGRDFGRYRIVAVLASDDLWTLCQAEDIEHNRKVSLTIFPPNPARTPELEAQLTEEARRLASLSHPNICETYETGVDGGIPYIASGGLDGQTLEERLAQGDLPLETALSIAKQVAGGMRAAHERGVLHLWLSPAAVMVQDTPGGGVEARISGFGRAALAAGDRKSDVQAFAALVNAMAQRGAPSISDSCAGFDDVLRELNGSEDQAAKPRTSLWKTVLALFVIVLVAAGGLIAFRHFRAVRIANSKPVRIVVLPFDSLGPASGDAGAAMAITESVAAGLEQPGTLQVISRTSARAIKDQRFTIPEIGSRLGVDFVLEGSVLLRDERCRILVRLVRASDDTLIWTEQHDVSWSDVFAVQEDVARKVQARLRKTVAKPAELSRGGARTQSPAALEALGRGLEAESRFLQTFDLEVFDASEAWYMRALELDPGYVDAMTELGRLYQRRLYPPRGPRTPWVMKSTAFLERALSHEPGNVMANSVLGSLYAQEGDVVRGVEYARRAVVLGGWDADAHGLLAGAYNAAGFYEEALECARQGVELDPISIPANSNLFWHAAKFGRIEEARRALALFRQSGGSAVLVATAEADILLREGKPEDVAPLLAAAHSEQIGETAVGLAAAMQSDLVRARQIVQHCRAQGPRTYDWLIRAAALLGDKDGAIDEIYGSPYYRNYRWVVTEPSLLRFRGDRRFQDLVRGLYDEWQRRLRVLQAGLRQPPPALPAPDEYFTGTGR